MTKKRLEITLETAEVTIVRRRKRLTQIWCASCGEMTGRLSIDEAASITSGGEPRLLRYMSEGRVHVIESSGTSHVCLNSLLKTISSDSESHPGSSGDAIERR